MSEPQDIDAKRIHCWNHALEAYGTAFVLQRRAARLRRIRRLLAFFGLVVPVLVGIIATRFYKNSPIPSWVIHSAGVASAIQSLLALWALVAKWEDSLSEAVQAAQKNFALHTRWEHLARGGDGALIDAFPQLAAEDETQRQSDVKLFVSDRERAVGMRAGLFKFGRACDRCSKVPTSEAPSFS